MFLMSNIYTYTDENAKVYSDNQLAVTFDFSYEVDVETAVEQISKLVSLADNKKDIEFFLGDIRDFDSVYKAVKKSSKGIFPGNNSSPIKNPIIFPSSMYDFNICCVLLQTAFQFVRSVCFSLSKKIS